MRGLFGQKVGVGAIAGMAAAALIQLASVAQAEPVGQTAVFTGLDKITARISRLEADIGTRVQFGTLEILAQTCNKRPPEETPETTAFVEVFDVGTTLASELQEEVDAAPVMPQEPERIFSGWMFASSPGLNAVEHPVYDVWLIDCKMSELSTPTEPSAPAASE
ncbi:MAG: glycosyl hydrolase family 5 [Rhodobiaceae bacterium]|nr:MAG: glycosyl hydrolase family 5 [Rhodobiaceae bacterium]